MFNDLDTIGKAEGDGEFYLSKRKLQPPMVTVVEKALLDPERLEQLLVMLDEAGWQFFQALAAEDASLEVRLNDQKYAQLFSKLGYIRYDRNDQRGQACNRN